jgi:hypothetical protein
LVAGINDSTSNIVFLLIQLELRQHPTDLAYISSRLLGWPIVLKTSQSIWLYPVFAFIRYVSIHLDISATVLRSASEKLLSAAADADAVMTRPALRGQTKGVLVGRDRLIWCCHDKGGQGEERSDVRVVYAAKE